MLKGSARSEYTTILQIIGSLFILQIAIALLTDGFCLSFDEAMWHYIGRNWFRNGLAPYAGGVDNKSPLIFAVFGLSDRLFGVNYWFPRVLASGCEVIGLFYIYKIARLVVGHKAGVLAVSFYGLSLLWHDTGGKYVSYTETYEVLFVIVAFYRFLAAKEKKDIFIAGLLIGIATAFRITAVFAAVLILVNCFRKHKFYAMVFVGGALASTLTLVLIAFLLHVDLGTMFTNMLFDNFNSGSATDHSFSWKLHNFADKFIWSGMPLFYPLVVGYLFIKRKVNLFVWWFILAFVGICAVGIFDAVHLKEVLPSLSLMSGVFVASAEDRFRWPAIPVILLVWLVFIPKESEPVRNFGKLFLDIPTKIGYCQSPYLIPDEGTRKKLGQYVRDQTSLADKVYIAGFGAQVQVYSERISPTIYFNVTQTPMAKTQFYSDVQRTKPAMILVPKFEQYKETVGKDMRDFVDSLVARDYRLVGCEYNYNIYRLKK
jgi:hypothetical protein